jgi:hypothetical protein
VASNHRERWQRQANERGMIDVVVALPVVNPQPFSKDGEQGPTKRRVRRREPR